MADIAPSHLPPFSRIVHRYRRIALFFQHITAHIIDHCKRFPGYNNLTGDAEYFEKCEITDVGQV